MEYLQMFATILLTGFATAHIFREKVRRLITTENEKKIQMNRHHNEPFSLNIDDADRPT